MTVTAAEAGWAEALATAILAGPEEAPQLARRHGGGDPRTRRRQRPGSAVSAPSWIVGRTQVNDHLTWYVSGGSGSSRGACRCIDDLGLALRHAMFRRRVSRWWLLGVHRFLGALAVVFMGVHVASLLLDGFVHFGFSDVLIRSPARGTRSRSAGAMMYLLVAIEVTSLAKSRLPYRWWRTVHLGSYPLFALATVHSLSAGTDTTAVINDGLAVALGDRHRRRWSASTEGTMTRSAPSPRLSVDARLHGPSAHPPVPMPDRGSPGPQSKRWAAM